MRERGDWRGEEPLLRDEEKARFRDEGRGERGLWLAGWAAVTLLLPIMARLCAYMLRWLIEKLIYEKNYLVRRAIYQILNTPSVSSVVILDIFQQNCLHLTFISIWRIISPRIVWNFPLLELGSS